MQLQLFKIAVSAFIVRDGKLLILKRRDDEKFLPGVWEVPGGGVDEGETIENAVVRETKEEAGMEVIPQKLFGFFEYVDGFGQKTVNLNFSCQLSNQSQEPNVSFGEMEKAEWATIDDLDKFIFTSDTMREACKDALNAK